MLRFSRLQLVFVVLFNEATDISLLIYSRSPLETHMLSLSHPTTSAIIRNRSHSGLRFAHLEFGCIHLKSVVVSQKHSLQYQRHIPVHVIERGSHDLPESAISLYSILVHTCLCHHPSPSDDVGSTFGTSALLEINNRPQKTIQVIICGIVQLLKSLEAFR